MPIEVKVPALPESVADATVAAWHKKVGDRINRDENLLDLETDKVVLEVPAPIDGILQEITVQVGAVVKAGELLGRLEEASKEPAPDLTSKEKVEETVSLPKNEQAASPAVRRLLAEHNITLSQVKGSGKDNRVTKDDVLDFIANNKVKQETKPQEIPSTLGLREEKRVPMSRLRAKIAERLVEAQHNAAMLTTFNEVDLQEIINIRNQYKESFEKKYNARLGFMSFFTKAVVEALKLFPTVNASIDGQEIVYHGYYDIGIAVSTERGLVVPVLRDADQLSMAQIELNITEAANKARLGKLELADMQGGTFTITNGGVFGSLLATPIINPPQTGILGMHKIQERAVVINKQVVIRPMMYVALSYDHRLIDGKDSVQFLVTVKQFLEDPSRLILNI